MAAVLFLGAAAFSVFGGIIGIAAVGCRPALLYINLIIGSTTLPFFLKVKGGVENGMRQQCEAIEAWQIASFTNGFSMRFVLGFGMVCSQCSLAIRAFKVRAKCGSDL